MSPGRPAASVAATAPTSLAAAEAMTAMIQATIREAITPLVAVNERQAERIEALARENGRLTATVDALTAAQTKQEAQPAPTVEPASSEVPAPWWRSWWPWLALLVVVVVSVLVVVSG